MNPVPHLRPNALPFWPRLTQENALQAWTFSATRPDADPFLRVNIEVSRPSNEEIYRLLDEVVFSPTAGVCTPSPTNMAVLRARKLFGPPPPPYLKEFSADDDLMPELRSTDTNLNPWQTQGSSLVTFEYDDRLNLVSGTMAWEGWAETSLPCAVTLPLQAQTVQNLAIRPPITQPATDVPAWPTIAQSVEASTSQRNGCQGNGRSATRSTSRTSGRTGPRESHPKKVRSRRNEPREAPTAPRPVDSEQASPYVPNIGPDGEVILNSRQRRTFKRAEERVIDALKEALKELQNARGR